MPTISVIVPVYNVENYIRRCIDSILAQTFADFELILVDDGSTDGSSSICEEYTKLDKRVRVIHIINSGVSAARNLGMKYATGEFLTFCDSDDWYASEWLSKLLDAMQIHDVDMVVGRFLSVYEGQQQECILAHKTELCSIATYEEKIDYIYKQLFGGEHGWAVWSHLFRLSIVRENEIQFCETCGNFAEDLGFVLEYILYTKGVMAIDYTGYNYYIRRGSIMTSSSGDAKLDAHNEISLRFLALCKEKFNSQLFRDSAPIIHFLVMSCAYKRVLGTNLYRYLGAEVVKMKRYSEWKKMTMKLYGCRRELENRFGRFNARRMILLSHYCLHGNWKQFSIESFLLYKLNKPD